jgi:hypothetical protein
MFIYRIMTVALSAAVLFGLLAVVVPQPVEASANQVKARLEQRAYNFKRHGGGRYCRPINSRYRYLNRGQTYTISTTLYRGYHYNIIGAGDSGISDLDLEIYDGNGNLITRDRMTDAYPIVTSVPRWTGRFFIRIKAYRGAGFANVVICHY